ncbi:Hpt domain-containing protein [Roseibium litorale]|uniref:Hpt domain-containing protein n=1 Tax=Roseibium litorale TaxID=2803841 RepID=A0ABR9CRZ8_9HYPH|nr:Hpt domain-containing protein [Roseibium litorale]MBD8893657.1 Hpt domain-containing protein [Roseibium litorale]
MSSSALDMLIARHCETLKEMLSEFTALYRQGPVSGPPDLQAMEVLHKLKGSSGSIGFRDVNLAATELEALLKASADGHEAGGPHWEEAGKRLAALETLVRDIRPEQSSLFGRQI